MHKLIENLKKKVAFKETVNPGDVVVVAAEKPQMLFFAMIISIDRDNSRKDEWWHVSMKSLTIPLQAMQWTLRMPQICGQEIFTMGGEERFMAPVEINFQENGKYQETGEVQKDKQKTGGAAQFRVVK